MARPGHYSRPHLTPHLTQISFSLPALGLQTLQYVFVSVSLWYLALLLSPHRVKVKVAVHASPDFIESCGMMLEVVESPSERLQH